MKNSATRVSSSSFYLFHSSNASSFLPSCRRVKNPTLRRLITQGYPLKNRGKDDDPGVRSSATCTPSIHPSGKATNCKRPLNATRGESSFSRAKAKVCRDSLSSRFEERRSKAGLRRFSKAQRQTGFNNLPGRREA